MKRQFLRVAVYLRISVSERGGRDYTSIEMQRESCLAYIKSQGWECAYIYVDDGFSGGNLDRPDVKRLMSDIPHDKFDIAMVYKVDRLSRSLPNFAQLWELFDKHGIKFVSVTQAIDTNHSMGRLMLNVLISFAQFEREINSDRTSEKMLSMVQKGIRCCGNPVLGYDVTDKGKMAINQEEAERVRAILMLYIEHQSMISVLRVLDQRQWRMKRWVNRAEKPLGGQPFNKSSLYNLLTNVLYVGKIKYKKNVYQGQHERIVDIDTFDRVQQLLKRNGTTGGTQVRNKFGALLKGILRCKVCGSSMCPSHTTKNRTTRYRKYRCLTATKRGSHACPTKAISAPEIEQFIVDQIACIGRDPALIQEVLIHAQQQANAQLITLETELRTLESNLRQWHSDVRDIAVSPTNSTSVSQLADLHERIAFGEQRANEISSLISQLNTSAIDEAQISASLADFNSVWSMLTLRERTRVFELLLERVEYDPIKSSISITFHLLGLQTLSSQLQPHLEQTA